MGIRYQCLCVVYIYIYIYIYIRWGTVKKKPIWKYLFPADIIRAQKLDMQRFQLDINNNNNNNNNNINDIEIWILREPVPSLRHACVSACMSTNLHTHTDIHIHTHTHTHAQGGREVKSTLIPAHTTYITRDTNPRLTGCLLTLSRCRCDIWISPILTWQPSSLIPVVARADKTLIHNNTG